MYIHAIFLLQVKIIIAEIFQDATSQFSFTKQKSGVTGMILVSKTGAGKPDYLYSFGPDKHLTIHDYSVI